jgi:hypothetical protein
VGLKHQNSRWARIGRRHASELIPGFVTFVWR